MGNPVDWSFRLRYGQFLGVTCQLVPCSFWLLLPPKFYEYIAKLTWRNLGALVK